MVLNIRIFRVFFFFKINFLKQKHNFFIITKKNEFRQHEWIKTKNKTYYHKEKLPDTNFLSKCNPKLKKYVLEHADKKLIFVLNECMVNFLKVNIKLDEKNFKN